MERLLQAVLKKIEAVQPLEKRPLPEDIAQVRHPLGWLLVKNYNWTAPRIRKLYSNRITLRFPFLDVMGNGLYPAEDYDVPIFIFDISLTGKKVVTYINLVSLGEGEAYSRAYIEPFAAVHEKYRHLGTQDMAEWMHPYQSENGLYAMPAADQQEDVRACVMEYLDCYLEILMSAEQVTDAGCRETIRRSRERFVQDVITQDRAQKALDRLIGRRRLQLFQREVIS
jgi:hypothetical protein